jgi:hypothetical protein
MTSGQLTDNGDGTFDYVPSFTAVGQESGGYVLDTFTYTIEDENGYRDLGTVTIEIESDALEAFLPVVRSCKTLYYDNFSNPTSGWPVADTGSTLYTYQAGEYRILLRNPFSLAGAIPGVSFTSYVVTTDVRNPLNKSGTYGLLFGQKPGFTGFYTFEIDRTGHFEFWMWNNGWTLLKQGNSAALKTGAATNTITIVRNGNSTKAYANGKYVAGLSDSTFTGALNIGVWVTSFDDADLDIRYDNYKVEPIGCGLSTGLPVPLAFPDQPLPDPGPAWLGLEELPTRPDPEQP